MAANPHATAAAIPAVVAVPAASVLTAAQASLTNVDAAVSLAANRTQEAVVQAAQKNLPSSSNYCRSTSRETGHKTWMTG